MEKEIETKMIVHSVRYQPYDMVLVECRTDRYENAAFSLDGKARPYIPSINYVVPLAEQPLPGTLVNVKLSLAPNQD